MFKTAFVACVLTLAVAMPTFAACSSDDAMTKMSAVSDVLTEKVQAKPDPASKLMSEMGDIMGKGTVTDETCVKLDDLMVRAKKL
jgi:hypothetical protein